MRRRSWLIPFAIAPLLSSSPARAEPDDGDYTALGSVPQVGLGIAHHSADTSFDFTIRWSPAWHVAPRTFIGGFGEVRFDDLEVSLGPQVQLRVAGALGIASRVGVGAVADGENFAVAGVQLGQPYLGISVNGRRYFGERYELSINLDLSLELLLLPFVVPASP